MSKLDSSTPCTRHLAHTRSIHYRRWVWVLEEMYPSLTSPLPPHDTLPIRDLFIIIAGYELWSRHIQGPHLQRGQNHGLDSLIDELQKRKVFDDDCWLVGDFKDVDIDYQRVPWLRSLRHDRRVRTMEETCSSSDFPASTILLIRLSDLLSGQRQTIKNTTVSSTIYRSATYFTIPACSSMISRMIAEWELWRRHVQAPTLQLLQYHQFDSKLLNRVRANLVNSVQSNISSVSKIMANWPNRPSHRRTPDPKRLQPRRLSRRRFQEYRDGLSTPSVVNTSPLRSGLVWSHECCGVAFSLVDTLREIFTSRDDTERTVDVCAPRPANEEGSSDEDNLTIDLLKKMKTTWSSSRNQEPSRRKIKVWRSISILLPEVLSHVR